MYSARSGSVSRRTADHFSHAFQEFTGGASTRPTTFAACKFSAASRRRRSETVASRVPAAAWQARRCTNRSPRVTPACVPTAPGSAAPSSPSTGRQLLRPAMDPEAFLDIANQVVKLKMFPYFDIAHCTLCALSVREDLGTGESFRRETGRCSLYIGRPLAGQGTLALSLMAPHVRSNFANVIIRADRTIIR